MKPRETLPNVSPRTAGLLAFPFMVMVLFFATAPVRGAPVPRSSLDAGTLYGGAIVDQDWGRPVVSGDLDGDGYDEIIVAASKSFGGVLSKVYVMRGGPDAHRRGLVDLSSNGVHQVILAAALDDNLGASMATGDVNGDGVDDLLICASNATYADRASAGLAYLIYGGANFFDSATRDLSVAGSWDVRYAGPVAGGDMGGANLFGGIDAHGAAIGNLNGDAFGDVVLGVHLASGAAAQAGRVYVRMGGPVFSGFTFDLALSVNYSVRILGKGDSDELGTDVLTADLTGDGIDELILGNEYASQGLFTSEGAVHIYRGMPTWVKEHNLATSAAPITLLGWRADDNLGSAVAAGDFDSNGIADLAAAAPGADAETWNNQRGDGFVYGLLGSAAYQTGTHVIDYATATPDFLLIGEFEENLGTALSAGDFDGDGYDDVAASEWFSGPATNGSVDVLFGRAFSGNPVFTANATTNLRVLGEPGDRIGFWMAASDVNGDGHDEVVFSTPFNNGPIGANKGTAYVMTYWPGDFDADGDRDLADYAAFQGCFSGLMNPSALEACFTFDFDLDGDFDLFDFAEWTAVLGGPGEGN